MKCPNCGGNLGIEDAFCPYCGTPNAFAAKHQSDMAHFRQEYQRTQADVMQKASFMKRHGSWLVILTVLLVALVAGVVLNVYAFDIGYSMRTGDAKRSAAENAQMLDAYLEKGDYALFCGYYNANNVSLDYDNPYQAVRTAANSYVNLMRNVSVLKDTEYYSSRPKYVSDTCSYIADDLVRIYTLEQQYSYNTDRYLPPDKLVYVEDIRDRTAVLCKAYFGLTDEQVREIPNISAKRLAAMIEEGIES